ncbi:hypothetical protein N7478_002100 [Penicillium angulare]|uniref:uncharacterized protein n=1 Tax=Penicillium angulare TaxID=116970 RepID=UPI00254164F9|nr:uncharacterized protein N7478_002100 [Penicillium angulare]KAJ5289070.1 hypothetical protein N7478_002100 [Penicillium angulare]
METLTAINLRINKIGNYEFKQALNGQSVPRGLGQEKIGKCVIRGVRYHPGFGTELRGLLPECHIAEEARGSGHSAIYDDIMGASVRYNAMNDYTREIFAPTEGHLIGDTVVCKYLDIRFTYKRGTID